MYERVRILWWWWTYRYCDSANAKLGTELGVDEDDDDDDTNACTPGARSRRHHYFMVAMLFINLYYIMSAYLLHFVLVYAQSPLTLSLSLHRTVYASERPHRVNHSWSRVILKNVSRIDQTGHTRG